MHRTMADQPNNNGATFKVAMESLFCDEELSDVKFEGTDGGVVPAFRCILAARSPVFRSMLFGEFSEAKEDGVISLGYSSVVLKSVVQFCLTDESAILQAPSPQASTVMELADAANFYELPELKRKAQEAAIAEIKRQPGAACEFLREAVNMSLGMIEDFARETIRTKPNKTLVEGGAVVNLSSPVLQSIFVDEKIWASELTLFRVLLAWAGSSENVSRRAEAKALATSLRLERISTSELSSLVEPSGLVSQEQMMRAYKAQATQAEAMYAVQFDRMRHLVPCWEGFESSIALGNSHEFETVLLHLDFKIRAGVWKWSVNVEELCTYTCIGVASTSHDLARNEHSGDWLGRKKGAWVYGYNGFSYTKGNVQSALPQFQAGSVITFTLDLTGRGTLHASVDEGDSFQLFSDMLDAFREGQEVGFLPAVSLRSPGRVRFLGLEEAETI